jgi:hypothetical protein
VLTKVPGSVFVMLPSSKPIGCMHLLQVMQQ